MGSGVGVLVGLAVFGPFLFWVGVLLWVGLVVFYVCLCYDLNWGDACFWMIGVLFCVGVVVFDVGF